MEWLEIEAPHVACLQEIKASPEQVPQKLRELENYWSYRHGFKGYSGAALLVHKDLSSKSPMFFNPTFDIENRIAVTEVEGITIASIYMRNGGP